MSLAVRASSVKNSDDMKRSTDIRFKLLELPSTKVFTVDPNETGMIDSPLIWHIKAIKNRFLEHNFSCFFNFRC